MHPAEQKALADIDQHGCHVIHVLAEADLPPFSYSVGIERSCGPPEVLVIGLKRPLAHFVVNEYNQRARAGERFIPQQPVAGFIEGFDCQFLPVHPSHYEEYFGWNLWLYRGPQFSALQLVYPSTTGVWPWDKNASDWFRARQPLLARPLDSGAP